jgi:hypothetical protein
MKEESGGYMEGVLASLQEIPHSVYDGLHEIRRDLGKVTHLPEFGLSCWLQHHPAAPLAPPPACSGPRSPSDILEKPAEGVSVEERDLLAKPPVGGGVRTRPRVFE